MTWHVPQKYKDYILSSLSRLFFLSLQLNWESRKIQKCHLSEQNPEDMANSLAFGGSIHR